MSGIPSVDPTTWTLQTPVKNVKYKKLSHAGQMTFDSVQVTEEYLVLAEDLKDFMRELFPLPQLRNGIPVYSYMPLPGTMNVTASSVSWSSFRDGLPIDPFGGDPDPVEGSYSELVKVSVTYDDNPEKPGTPEDPEVDEADPETFLEIACSTAGEFIHSAMPESVWQPNAANPNAVEANENPNPPATIIVPETEWTLTWPKVNRKFFQDTFITRLRAILGKVNTAEYSLLYNAPAETLLFVGWEMSESRQFLFDTETQSLQYVQNPLRVTMKVLEKRIELVNQGEAGTSFAGHQHVWRPGSGWQKLLIDGTNPLYKTYDYDQLFETIPNNDEDA